MPSARKTIMGSLPLNSSAAVASRGIGAACLVSRARSACRGRCRYADSSRWCGDQISPGANPDKPPRFPGGASRRLFLHPAAKLLPLAEARGHFTASLRLQVCSRSTRSMPPAAYAAFLPPTRASGQALPWRGWGRRPEKRGKSHPPKPEVCLRPCVVCPSSRGIGRALFASALAVVRFFPPAFLFPRFSPAAGGGSAPFPPSRGIGGDWGACGGAVPRRFFPRPGLFLFFLLLCPLWLSPAGFRFRLRRMLRPFRAPLAAALGALRFAFYNPKIVNRSFRLLSVLFCSPPFPFPPLGGRGCLAGGAVQLRRRASRFYFARQCFPAASRVGSAALTRKVWVFCPGGLDIPRIGRYNFRGCLFPERFVLPRALNLAHVRGADESRLSS